MESSAPPGRVASTVLDRRRRGRVLVLLCSAFFIVLLDGIAVGLAALALQPVLLGDSWAVLPRRSYDPAGAMTITGILLIVRDGARGVDLTSSAAEEVS